MYKLYKEDKFYDTKNYSQTATELALAGSDNSKFTKKVETGNRIIDYLEELKTYREENLSEKEIYNQAITDVLRACDLRCGFYGGDQKPLTRDILLEIIGELRRK